MLRVISCTAVVAMIGLITACAPVVHGRPMGSAEIAQRLQPLLLHAPTVLIGVHDLALDVPLRGALLADGFVAKSGSTWIFSDKALHNSRPCATRDRAARCFRLDEDRFLSIVRTTTSDGSLDAEPKATSIFAYRALPAGELGERLARSGALRCGTSPGQSAAWNGATTTAEGLFEISTAAQTSNTGMLLDAFCPHTRLQDGVAVRFMLDTQAR